VIELPISANGLFLWSPAGWRRSKSPNIDSP
jgi:hypothetical protein